MSQTKPETAYVRQLPLGPMKNFIYLVGAPEGREAFVIDPAWDVPAILGAVEGDGHRVHTQAAKLGREKREPGPDIGKSASGFDGAVTDSRDGSGETRSTVSHQPSADRAFPLVRSDEKNARNCFVEQLWLEVNA